VGKKPVDKMKKKITLEKDLNRTVEGLNGGPVKCAS